MVIFLHNPRSSAASLSSVRSIPDIVCISSIHLFVGRPLFLLPSPQASIIFYKPVCPHHVAKKQYLLFWYTLCLSDRSPLACPISKPVDSFVLSSVQETMGGDLAPSLRGTEKISPTKFSNDFFRNKFSILTPTDDLF